uniref:NADH-ubiquinone oxidoreductase chain 5 n=1 Tax=Nicrophorus nepalensis TaxID=307049 RepID=A0A8A5RBG2_NICNE|nr:NADH dehydrogenase subunit 5 [Nicrophorus nepalensis]QTG39874.1 NADH dehydrogenase subunit 5 [Nicrophorus nepalensis]
MLSICLIFFVLFLVMSVSLFLMSMNFMIMDYSLILEYELVSLNSSSLIMTILLDWMSLLFMSFVLFISSMVINYSDEYMSGDLNIKRFILLVIMFVLSMMFLIISPNLISILLGWDGLGLVSYCLVIYYQNVKSFNAGMLTALSNRIGDVALLMAIAWMMNYGSWNYVFYLEMMKNDFSMSFITYLVLLAAMTKSAQIPFSSWLPAAMAAPTPVSSLVHSSTLVTAGVYLLIRFYPAMDDLLLFILLLIGSMTMFMAGLGANFEFDLKKIIALSTLSQLGLMMSILALGELNLTFFHLLTHALFKATLFMCAGCMIHSMNNNQDIRYMGSMIVLMPLTCCFFNISNLALCGLPFLSGFYSKDLIIEVLSMNYLNIYIYIIYFLSTGLTACYTFRLFYYSMFGNMNFLSLNMISDHSFTMLKSMGGLIFFVIMGGSMLMWMILSVPYIIILPLFMKLMALLVTLSGFYIGLETSKFYINYELKSLKFLKSSLFFSSMWNMPILSTFMLNKNVLLLSGLFYKSVDQGWSEYFGSQNIFINLKNGSMFLQTLYKNNLKIYMIMLVIWVTYLFLI